MLWWLIFCAGRMGLLIGMFVSLDQFMTGNWCLFRIVLVFFIQDRLIGTKQTVFVGSPVVVVFSRLIPFIGCFLSSCSTWVFPWKSIWKLRSHLESLSLFGRQARERLTMDNLGKRHICIVEWC